jgi:uncharacterized protein (DUF58 family)
MSWLGLALLLVGAFLAYKLVGVLLKLLMFALALVGAYWFMAPSMGWPSVSDLFYVLGPDFGGRRIEEVLQPSGIASEVTGRVVDGVVERILSPAPEALPAPAPGGEVLPEPMTRPLPEPQPSGSAGVTAPADEGAAIR